MSKKRVFKWVGIGIVLAWFVITILAYNQHRVSDEVYIVDQYVTFENYAVLVKDVEIYDYQKTAHFYFYQKMYNWLPPRVAYSLSRMMSFYNSSISKLENGPEYVVNCEIFTENGSKFNIQEENLRIVLYEELPVENYPNRGTGSSTEDNSNDVEYHYVSKWFDKDYKGLSLKDYNTDEVIVIPFTQVSITKNYSFTNPKSSLFHKTATNISDTFIAKYVYVSKEAASAFIFEGQIDRINWSLLEGLSRDLISRYELSYESYDPDLGDVFNLLIEKIDGDILNFRMIYTDEQWWIVDIV